MTSWPQGVKEISEEDLLLWSKRLVPLYMIGGDLLELQPPEDLRATHFMLMCNPVRRVEQTNLLTTGTIRHSLSNFDDDRYSTGLSGTVAEVYAQIPYMIRKDSLWEDITNKGLLAGFYLIDISNGPLIATSKGGSHHHSKASFVLFSSCN